MVCQLYVITYGWVLCCILRNINYVVPILLLNAEGNDDEQLSPVTGSIFWWRAPPLISKLRWPFCGPQSEEPSARRVNQPSLARSLCTAFRYLFYQQWQRTWGCTSWLFYQKHTGGGWPWAVKLKPKFPTSILFSLPMNSLFKESNGKVLIYF